MLIESLIAPMLCGIRNPNNAVKSPFKIRCMTLFYCYLRLVSSMTLGIAMGGYGTGHPYPISLPVI